MALPFRLRFSLRVMLIAIALVALVAYWLAMPTLNAQRFVAAINARDWPTADRLCVGGEKFPGDWPSTNVTFNPHASLGELTLAGLLHGERDIMVSIDYGDGKGIIGCGMTCQATRQGIVPGMAFP
jgi:hypothetical protein